VTKKASRDGDSHHFTVITLADLIQVGGVILGILSTFVFAATARARIVTTLVVCATILLCGVFYLRFAKRVEWRSLRISLQVLLSVIMVAVAAVYVNSPAQATGPSGSPAQPTEGADSPGSPGNGIDPGNLPVAAGSTPVPLIQKTGYVLRPSSFVDTNDQDKVDFDTGCPGWGEMYPHIGPPRCGGLADLIIDPDSLHTAGDRPDIIVLPPGVTGTYSSCRDLLTATPSTGVNSIPASNLHDGDRFCVETDYGHTAIVHIDNIAKDDNGQVTSVTIDFQVWFA
jgi:hypothetical protein